METGTERAMANKTSNLPMVISYHLLLDIFRLVTNLRMKISIVMVLIHKLCDYTPWTHIWIDLDHMKKIWSGTRFHWLDKISTFFKFWTTFDFSLGHSADWRYPPPPPQFAYAGPPQFSRPGMAYSLPPYRPMNGYMTYPTKTAYPVKVRMLQGDNPSITIWQSF